MDRRVFPYFPSNLAYSIAHLQASQKVHLTFLHFPKFTYIIKNMKNNEITFLSSLTSQSKLNM